jgi:hypothetical protein
MSPPSPTYQYQRLRAPTEVRLLKISRLSIAHNLSSPESAQLQGHHDFPAASENTIGYSIIHVDIESAPNYEAVSYVWGSPHKSDHIQLLDGRILPVTATVVFALPHLAKVCQTGYLWIDQITIDQSNISERNDQVKVMGQIYRRTSRCLVWMDDGETLDIPSDLELAWDTETGEEVRRFLRSFGEEEIEQSSQVEQSMSPTEASSSSLTLRKTSSREYSRVREHLLWFLEHPWFRRTWVFQEFLLPKEALFLIRYFELPREEVKNVFGQGYLSVAWFEKFKHRLHLDQGRAMLFQRAPGLQFLLSVFQSLHVGMSSFLDIQRNSFAYYEVLGFTDILNFMAPSQAQHDHDHAYAFLGLAPFLMRHMTVDYTLPTEEAFAATVKALIKESRSLDLLDSLPLAHISKSRLRLPSWVINWTVRYIQTPILCHDTLFEASGRGFGLPSINKCKHYDSLSSNWNELDVAGKIIDTVRYKLTPFSVYQTTPSLDIDPLQTSACLPWESSTLDRFTDQMASFGIPDIGLDGRKALLRTLFMDGVVWAALDAHESKLPLYRTEQQVIGEWRYYEKIDRVISVLANPTVQPNFEDLPHGATLRTLHELSKMQYCRLVVYCSNGRFALASDHVDKGDKIVILHGARVPFVLRPRPDGKFSLIGQCYYDGAMYGDMADEDEDNADIFTLV